MLADVISNFVGLLITISLPVVTLTPTSLRTPLCLTDYIHATFEACSSSYLDAPNRPHTDYCSPRKRWNLTDQDRDMGPGRNQDMGPGLGRGTGTEPGRGARQGQDKIMGRHRDLITKSRHYNLGDVPPLSSKSANGNSTSEEDGCNTTNGSYMIIIYDHHK